jgi:hypothetical protein
MFTTRNLSDMKAGSPEDSSARRVLWRVLLLRFVAVSLFYCALTSNTGAFFMADTLDYADSILTRHEFWEFGHLLWRPFGSLCLELSSLFLSHAIWNLQGVITTLCTLNWIAGAVNCVLLCVLLRRFKVREWIYYAVMPAFACSQALLNYVHAGSPYPCGMALIFSSLSLSLTDSPEPVKRTWRALFAGAFAALAMLLWLPFVTAMPAVLTAPWFLRSRGAPQRRLVVFSATAFLVTTIAVYGAVIIKLDIGFGSGLIAWFKASSHGLPLEPSLTKPVFGLARSFINMGDDGLLYKRFLSHDPYNPVQWPELFRMSLWKLVLFYTFLVSLIVSLARWDEGKPMLCLLVLNALPVLVFAVLWQGGDMERYLPLYPILYVALGCALNSPAPQRWFKGVAAVFLATMIASNLPVMAKSTLAWQEAASASRIASLRPLLKPHSILIALNLQDELVRFSRNYPLHPLNLDNRFSFRVVVEPGVANLNQWRSRLAVASLSTWRRHGDVWVSARVLSRRPKREWSWVEGGASPVRWPEISQLFSQLKFGPKSGGEDGFVLLQNSPRNRKFLERLIEEMSVANKDNLSTALSHANHLPSRALQIRR